MVAADVLADLGMTVLGAGRADEALAVIEAVGPIDLLFADVNMPGDLDGLALAAIAHAQQPDLKLIVTTGAKNLHASDIPDYGVFIAKPYAIRALAQLVEAKLSASR